MKLVKGKFSESYCKDKTLQGIAEYMQLYDVAIFRDVMARVGRAINLVQFRDLVVLQQGTEDHSSKE